MKKTFLLLLWATLGGFAAQAQTNFYVSPSGRDTNPGTLAKPWKTVQKACNAATPGSTVYLRTGTYKQKVSVNVSGTAGNYITFTNYNGEAATLDGGSTAGTILSVVNKTYLKFVGLRFQNAIGNYAKGFYVEGSSHHIEIRNCTITNVHFSSNPSAVANANRNANPLLFWGNNASQSINNIVIDGNQIFNCRTGYSESLTLDGNVELFEITNNTVRDVSNIGIDVAGNYGVSPNPATDQGRNGVIRGNTCFNCRSPYATAAGIYIDGGRDVLIERNRVYNCNAGIEVGCEIVGKTTSNITVRNNLTYNNDDWEIGMGGYDFPSGSGKVVNSKIFNNTSYKGNTAKSDYSMYALSYLENCTVQNNIVQAGVNTTLLWGDTKGAAGNSLNYNVWNSPGGTNNTSIGWDLVSYSRFSTYQAQTGRDANSLFANATFVNTVTPDLRLQATSLAINAGNPAFVAASGEIDFWGSPRVAGGRVDVGAYEQPAPAARISTETPDAHSSVKVYPSVTNDRLTVESEVAISHITLSDATGRSMQEHHFEEPTFRQDLSVRALPEGLFVVLVQTTEGRPAVRKVYVRH